MTDYPSDIKYLDAATFKQEMEDPAYEPAKMDGGYTLTRPRFTRSPRRTFSWRYVAMRDADRKKFEDFWKSVRGRSNAFNWRHPITGEVINVRFGEMKCIFSRAGFGPVNIWDSETIVVEEI